jgi:hypothetical protein
VINFEVLLTFQVICLILVPQDAKNCLINDEIPNNFGELPNLERL